MPIESRIPCTSCGSMTRVYAQINDGSLPFHSELKYKAKRGSKGEAFIKGAIGDTLHRILGRWMRLERVIDRENDAYKEKVADPRTGDVIHKNEEPLSKHVGHGDDRKNKPTK
jgi:hypothetical protein